MLYPDIYVLLCSIFYPELQRDSSQETANPIDQNPLAFMSSTNHDNGSDRVPSERGNISVSVQLCKYGKLP